MISYIYITFALLLYPTIGRIITEKTNTSPGRQWLVVRYLSIISILVMISLHYEIITIWQNLNWLLLSLIYLTICVLLHLEFFQIKALKSLFFRIGYFIAIFGFFFLLIASLDLETDQKVWLSEDLIYQEKNTGQGPEANRSKEIEVYKTLQYAPFLACKIASKSYDTWYLHLDNNLILDFSKSDQVLYLKSRINDSQFFVYKDTIRLSKE